MTPALRKTFRPSVYGLWSLVFSLASLVVGLWSIVFSLFLAFGLSTARADTVIKRDGRELKGIIVEDYYDRIVLSTPDGEVQVLKSDVRELSYDSEEDNLIKLGDLAKERSNYEAAYSYYEKAFNMNPNSKPAKDGMMYLKGFLFRKEEAKKEEDIKRRTEFERYQVAGMEEKTAEDLKNEREEKLRFLIGMALKITGNNFEVDEVLPQTPAADAGIKKGDYIVALWGKFTGYMAYRQFIDLLVKDPSIEIKTTFERSLEIVMTDPRGPMAGSRELTGAVFSMEFDGLTVTEVKEGSPAEKGGLRKGDLVIAIDDNSTRYMPMKTAIELIRGSKSGSVNLIVRRETTIWKRK